MILTNDNPNSVCSGSGIRSSIGSDNSSSDGSISIYSSNANGSSCGITGDGG